MDPLFPLIAIVGIAGAASLAWRATRPRASDTRRTSWTPMFGPCRAHSFWDKYECPRGADFRAGKPACTACGAKPDTAPMSQYQVDGGGEGLRLDPEGPFIASLCEGEWRPKGPKHREYERLPEGKYHAPLFDLDYPAALEKDGTLFLRKPGDPLRYAEVGRHLAAIGLARPAVEPAPPREREDGQRGIEGYRSMASVAPEAAFRLCVPAKLLPSSTEGHFHLYLETRLDWDAYLRLMRAMAEADLLETRWVEMSARRKMAMLRKPGVLKARPQG